MTTLVKRDFIMKQEIAARTAICFLALGAAELAPFAAQAPAGTPPPPLRFP
jgi:hypothetical protein